MNFGTFANSHGGIKKLKKECVVQLSLGQCALTAFSRSGNFMPRARSITAPANEAGLWQLIMILKYSHSKEQHLSHTYMLKMLFH